MTTPSPSPTGDRLTVREKIGYGLGDTASNFVFYTINTYLFFYYTDVIGLAAGAVGTLFLVARLFDTVTDPLMGAIADRTNSRWGKYRPYLAGLAIPFGIVGFLLFAVPDAEPSIQLTYAYVTYVATMLIYTAINIPYSALLGVITSNSAERTSVSTFRFACAFGGQFLIGAAALPLVAHFGEGDRAVGYKATMTIFAVVAVLLFWTTFATTRERVQPPKNQKPDIKKELLILIKNRPWVIMFIAGIFTLTNVAVRGAVTLHYFKYYVGDDGSPWFWKFDLSTVFLTSGTTALILGVISTFWLSRLWGKRQLMIGLSAINAVIMALFFVIPADAIVVMFIMNFLGALIIGPTIPLVWSMFADVADYGQWKFGHRSTALVFSAAQFAQKLGLAIGGAIAGWMLSGYGFEANVDQSSESLLGIRLMFTLVPAAFAISAVVAIWFYPLSDKDVKQMEQDLAAAQS